MMIDLRKYNPQDVILAANSFQASYQSGTLSLVEVRLMLLDFMFRDAKGDYWFMNVNNTNWHRHDNGKWAKESETPDALLGADSLFDILPLTSESEGTEFEEEFTGLGEGSLNAVEVMPSIVSTIKTAFDQGQISSLDAYELLADQYVVDKQGRIWLVGYQSSMWYYYDSEQWIQSPEPPSEDSLVREEPEPGVCGVCEHVLQGETVCPNCGTEIAPTLVGATDEVYASIFEFFTSGFGSLPESITDDWDPPEGMPEALIEPGVVCANCNNTNSPGSRYCSQCGSALGCPNCGKENPPESKFCNECGHQLTSTD
jgi:hypothetical protein